MKRNRGVMVVVVMVVRRGWWCVCDISPILTGYLTNISKGSPVSPILTGYLTNISKGSPVNDYRCSSEKEQQNTTHCLLG